MFDSDGYPTDETLRTVRTFTGSPHQLVDLLQDITRAYGVVTTMAFEDRYGRPAVEVYMATGGWSGNESVIGALERSAFWFLYWNQSARGGAFWFHVPVDLWDSPLPEWPSATSVEDDS